MTSPTLRLLAGTLTSVLLASPVVPCAAPGEPSAIAGEDEAAVVIYDASAFGPRNVLQHSSIGVHPYSLGSDGFEEQDARELLRDLIFDHVAPGEFEFAGRTLSWLEDGRLLVIAPAAVQARIGRLFEYLGTCAARRARVLLEVYAVSDGRTLPEDLPVAGLPALLADGSLQLVHRRTDEMQLGEPEMRRLLRRRTLVHGHNGEIAEQSGGSYPVLRDIETGLQYGTLLDETPGGEALRLRYALNMRELLPVAPGQVTVQTVLMGDDGLDQLSTSLPVDRPAVAYEVLCGSARLAVGEGLVALARCESHGGLRTAGWLVHLELEQLDPPPAPLRLDGEGLAVVGVSDLVWGRPNLPIPSAALLQGWSSRTEGFGVDPNDEPEFCVVPAEAVGDWREPLFLLEDSQRWVQEGGFDPSAATFSLGGKAVLAAPLALLPQRVAALESLLPRRRGLQLQLLLLESVPAARVPREVGRVQLALECGTRAGVFVGCSRSAARGGSLDVASHALVSPPEEATLGEGLGVLLEADASGTVRMKLALADLDLETLLLSPHALDRPDAGAVDLALRLLPDGERRQVANLGTRLDPGAGERTLWARLDLED